MSIQLTKEQTDVWISRWKIQCVILAIVSIFVVIMMAVPFYGILIFVLYIGGAIGAMILAAMLPKIVYYEEPETQHYSKERPEFEDVE